MFWISNLVLKTGKILLDEEPREFFFGSCMIISTERQPHKEEEACPVKEREEEPVVGMKTVKSEGGESRED